MGALGSRTNAQQLNHQWQLKHKQHSWIMEQVLNPHKEQAELHVMVWGGNRAVSKAMALVSWAAACWHFGDMIEAIIVEQNSGFWGICLKRVWCIQHPI